MSNPFLGQITIVGFNFAPRGYAQCNGQILSINQNQSLFALLGTTYGGDGRSTFGLPELRGRTPIHIGSANGTSHPLGNKGGAETVTLIESNMPGHNHRARASSDAGDQVIQVGQVLAEDQIYVAPRSGTLVAMGAAEITDTGSDQSHNNMQPFLTLKYNIALAGVFPSRN